MKKLLLLITMMSFAFTQAQSIGIIGSATPTGWVSDTDMTTTDNVNYSITMTFVAGEVKFRADDAWTDSWGGGSFPAGTAVYNGGNILNVPAGTYTVNFNLTTLEYSFTGTSAFASIGIWGPAVDTLNGYLGPDVDMSTTDGINYVLSAYTFTSGTAKFRKNDDNTLNYGSTGFPTGTAVLDGPEFYVPGGEYTVYYNADTGNYSFEFPSVGYLGTVLNPTGFDGPDVDLTTTDGFVYTGTGYLEMGEIKFRLDNMWTTNWGGTGMIGTASQNGSNIMVDAAGTYDIMFNRETLEYSITPSLGLNSNSIKSFSVYPNPSSSSWNFSSFNKSIENITIYNLAGKIVITLSPKASEASVDAASLSSGTYFAKIKTLDAEQTIKVVKE